MNTVCQLCNQARAIVLVTDLMPEKRERHLCEDCAVKEGVIIKQQPTTNEILQQFIKHKVSLGRGEDVTCPKCSLTFREFQVKGQLGCAHDYTAFQNLLLPLIKSAHEGAEHHVGKVPPTADETVRRQTQLLRLRNELQEAVEQENYELAAGLRDKIRILEAE